MSFKVLNQIRSSSHRLNTSKDLDVLLESIGCNTNVVMIGEASHGTHEFYKMRAELSKRLIQEKGFNFIGVEGDFPDCYRVNEYINCRSKDVNVDEALGEFKRFPRWMWRNTVVAEFVDWMKQYNESEKGKELPCNFMGLDLYSMNSSREAVLNYLSGIDKETYKNAKKLYSCFDKFGCGDTNAYAIETGLRMKKGCKDEVYKILKQMLNKESEYMNKEGVEQADKYFYGVQNAIVVKNVENYYSNMYEGGAKTWNIRDEHMVQTLKFALDFYGEHYGHNCKMIVWAHNSHLGDASQTEMSQRNEINLGQRIREEYPGEQSFNIGFTTYDGYVTAADDWDNPPHFFKVNKGMDGSFEKLFHDVCDSNPKGANEEKQLKSFALVFNSKNGSSNDSHVCSNEVRQYLSLAKYERAIGVIYRPKSEFHSHYFKAHLSKQFDALIHIDRTHALKPLEISPQWVKGEKEHIPETFPFEY